MLNKQYSASRVNLDVASRPNVLDKQHFVNKAVKLAFTFL